MAFDFPNSPTTSPPTQVTGPGGAVYQWDGVKWISAVGAAVYAPIASPTFTGDPKAPTPTAGDSDTSVATTAFVAATVAPAWNNVGRNLLHNPLFNIQQRGTGPFTATGYTLDRWYANSSLDTISWISAPINDTERAAIADEAAQVCIQNTFTGNAGAAAYNEITQMIEKVSRLSGKTVTLSFYAVAGSALKLGINATQSFGTGGSPSGGVNALATGNSVTLSTTWARYTTTIALPSIAGKTLGTNGNDFTQIRIALSSGASANQFFGNIGVQSGVVKLWGVQLEVGAVATQLEKPDPQQDLAKCQRFFQIGTSWMGANGTAGSASGYQIMFPVTMRAAPNITNNPPGYSNCGSFLAQQVSTSGFLPSVTVTATGYFNFNVNWSASADL